MKAELIDVMGDDLRVANAARVSFDKETYWDIVYADGDKDLAVRDQKLINYLATHGHWTPFAHVQITMRETVPIFVARQRFKHMVGFTYNEVSRRYVDDTPEFYFPDAWRGRAENKKQGSSEEEVEEPVVMWGNDKYDYSQVIDLCVEYYEQMLKAGIAPEQARMVLPQSMYTSYYVTGSLAAWARAYSQRIHEHAQKEIQDLAKQWDDIISNITEIKYSWGALAHATKEG
jgi:thymidylate synthase (FAD)